MWNSWVRTVNEWLAPIAQSSERRVTEATGLDNTAKEKTRIRSLRMEP